MARWGHDRGDGGLIAHVLQKLDLRDRTQVVVAAYESGIVRPGAG